MSCGKTHWLKTQVEQVVRTYESSMLVTWQHPAMVCSLTRAAAAEVASRVELERRAVGTLHSHCFHAIGRPRVVHQELVKRWNSQSAFTLPVIDFVKPPKGSSDQADKEVERLSSGETPRGWDDQTKGVQDGRDLYQAAERLRHMRISSDQWPPLVKRFHEDWTEFKREYDVVDFTDMIEQALLTASVAPGNPWVILVDEAQDLSKLERDLIMKWGDRAGAVMLVGDPLQCQPTGTRVLTDSGYMKIEDLDSSLHRLISFDRRASAVVGRTRGGYSFEKGSRFYCGQMIRVDANGATTHCTPNHRWSIRIRPGSRGGWHCVYLMRKEDYWRVGRCRLFYQPRKNDAGMLGIRGRLRGERGDAAWVLKLCESKLEAEAWQQIVSCEWGIPTSCFFDHECLPRGRELIELIFKESRPRYEECLQHFGRDLEFPLATRATGTGVRSSWLVQACNLIPEVMQIPVATEKKDFEWHDFSLSRENYEGMVHSLDVKPYEHYVVEGGMITHNTLYAFRGSDPYFFVDPEVPSEKKKVLSQSYRVPKQVLEASRLWVSRQLPDFPQAEYKPRVIFDEVYEGSVRVAEHRWKDPAMLTEEVEAILRNDPNETVMIQATCSYMLYRLTRDFKQWGIPFCHPWRRSQGAWNPLRFNVGSSLSRLASMLTVAKDTPAPQPWTYVALGEFAKSLKSRGVFRKGQKKRVMALAQTYEAHPEETPMAYELEEWFGEESFLYKAWCGEYTALEFIEWWHKNKAAGISEPMAKYICAIAKRFGSSALLKEPRVFVGTIHSFKGAEADHVYVFPDLPPVAFGHWQRQGGSEYEEIIRAFYVAMTRSQQHLTICRASSKNCAPLRRLVGEYLNGISSGNGVH